MMLFSKTALLLVHLSLYYAHGAAWPANGHQPFPGQPRPSSSSRECKFVTRPRTTSQPAVQTTPAAVALSSAESTTAPPTGAAAASQSTITSMAALTINLPAIAGFSFPGAVLRSDMTVATAESVNLPVVPGFSAPGVAFETTEPALGLKTTAPFPKTTSSRPTTKPSSPSTTPSSHSTSRPSTSTRKSANRPSRSTTASSARTTSHSASVAPASAPTATSVHSETLRPSSFITSTISHPAKASTATSHRLLTPTASLPDQGLPPPTSVATSSASPTATPVPASFQPSLSTGSQVALGVTIPGGVMLVGASVFFFYVRRRNRGTPFQFRSTYQPANLHDDSRGPPPGAAPPRLRAEMLGYASPLAQPPTAAPSTAPHSTSNGDEITQVPELPTEPMPANFINNNNNNNDNNNSRWGQMASALKPWASPPKPPPAYPEIAYLYDPSLSPKSAADRGGRRDAITRHRDSLKTVSSATEQLDRERSPSYQAVSPSSPEDRGAALSRSGSLALSPRVRFQNDELVMELLPEMQEPSPELDAAVELPDYSVRDVLPPRAAAAAPLAPPARATNTLDAQRMGSISKALNAAGATALSIDTSVQRGGRDVSEASGWGDGRWRGPPRRIHPAHAYSGYASSKYS